MIRVVDCGDFCLTRVGDRLSTTDGCRFAVILADAVAETVASAGTAGCVPEPVFGRARPVIVLAVPLAVTCVAAFGDEAFDCDPSESFDAELDPPRTGELIPESCPRMLISLSSGLRPNSGANDSRGCLIAERSYGGVLR